MKLAGNLYVYLWNNPTANNCNTYVINGEIPILIDPGHRNFISYLTSQMKADNIPPDSIKVVMLTHSHPDHLEGISEFMNPDVYITMHKKEYEFLKNDGSRLYMAMGASLPDFKVKFFLKEGELNIGKERFRIYHTPGHSPGSICIHYLNENALITGDLIFAMGFGRFDLPGGNPEELKNSLIKVSKLRINYMLPGHGPALKGEHEIAKLIEAMAHNLSSYI